FRAQDTVPSQRIACLNYTWTRPTWFTHPASRSLFIRGSWFDGILHPNRKFRPIHGPVIGLVLQPVIPPGHDLLQKTNRRPWLSNVRITVTPKANQTPLCHVEYSKQTEHRIRISICPPASSKYRNYDIGIVFVELTVSPVLVFALVYQPLFQPEPTMVQ